MIRCHDTHKLKLNTVARRLRYNAMYPAGARRSRPTLELDRATDSRLTEHVCSTGHRDTPHPTPRQGQRGARRLCLRARPAGRAPPYKPVLSSSDM